MNLLLSQTVARIFVVVVFYCFSRCLFLADTFTKELTIKFFIIDLFFMPKKTMLYVSCLFRHKQSIGSEPYIHSIFQMLLWYFTKQISVTFLHDEIRLIVNHLKCDLGLTFF